MVELTLSTHCPFSVFLPVKMVCLFILACSSLSPQAVASRRLGTPAYLSRSLQRANLLPALYVTPEVACQVGFLSSVFCLWVLVLWADLDSVLLRAGSPAKILTSH